MGSDLQETGMHPGDELATLRKMETPEYRRKYIEAIRDAISTAMMQSDVEVRVTFDNSLELQVGKMVIARMLEVNCPGMEGRLWWYYPHTSTFELVNRSGIALRQKGTA